MHSDFYSEEIRVFRHALSKRVHVLVKSSEAVEVHGGRAIWLPSQARPRLAGRQ